MKLLRCYIVMALYTFSFIAKVLLWKITRNTTYRADLEATFNDVWFPGGEVSYTPGGSGLEDTVGQQQICRCDLCDRTKLIIQNSNVLMLYRMREHL